MMNADQADRILAQQTPNLVERLRIMAQYVPEQASIYHEAATEIERLRAPPQGACVDPIEDLVRRFSEALLKKLRLAQANGRSGWDRDDWEVQCQRGLVNHLYKGDPRDVAAYCAFMWHHGWVTKAPADFDNFSAAGEEPDLWVCFADNGNIRAFTRDHNRKELFRLDGLDMQPFYAAPQSLAKATKGKAGMAEGEALVRRSTAGTGLLVGAADAVQSATSEIMDVTAGETAPNSRSPAGSATDFDGWPIEALEKVERLRAQVATLKSENENLCNVISEYGDYCASLPSTERPALPEESSK